MGKTCHHGPGVSDTRATGISQNAEVVALFEHIKIGVNFPGRGIFIKGIEKQLKLRCRVFAEFQKRHCVLQVFHSKMAYRLYYPERICR